MSSGYIILINYEVFLKLNSAYFLVAFPVFLKVLSHWFNILWKPESSDNSREKSIFNLYVKETFDLTSHGRLDQFKNWIRCEWPLEVFDVGPVSWKIILSNYQSDVNQNFKSVCVCVCVCVCLYSGECDMVKWCCQGVFTWPSVDTIM